MRTLALPLLGGCGFGLAPAFLDEDSGALPDSADPEDEGDADADADADADGDADADIRVDSIEPYYGTTAGGDEVLIRASGFDEGASVRIGTVEAEVLSADPRRGEIKARTPRVDAEGPADVLVESGGGEGRLDDGFTYFADGTGLAGIAGAISWVDIVGNYWETEDPAGFGAASITLLAWPTEFSYWEFYSDRLDSCQAGGWTTDKEVYAYDGSAVRTARLVTNSGTRVDLQWSNTYYSWSNHELASNEFGTSWDLDAMQPDGLPEFSVEDLARAGSSFSVSQPRIDGPQAPEVSRSLNVTWSGSGGDFVILYLARRDSSGRTAEEEVFCIANDDGTFQVPSSAWTAWPTGRQLDIQVGRANRGAGTLPYNGARSEVYGIRWIYGAGFTR
jgi:hypothetical protein